MAQSSMVTASTPSSSGSSGICGVPWPLPPKSSATSLAVIGKALSALCAGETRGERAGCALDGGGAASGRDEPASFVPTAFCGGRSAFCNCAVLDVTATCACAVDAPLADVAGSDVAAPTPIL
eukprot:5845030-Pleurochrysis_carterae.AAC.5